MEWIKPIDQLPPLNTNVFIKRETGEIYVGTRNGQPIPIHSELESRLLMNCHWRGVSLKKILLELDTLDKKNNVFDISRSHSLFADNAVEAWSLSCTKTEISIRTVIIEKYLTLDFDMLLSQYSLEGDRNSIIMNKRK